MKAKAKSKAKTKPRGIDWTKRAPNLVQPEAEMERPFIAVVINVDGAAARKTYSTADAAYTFAIEKISSATRADGKRLKVAICKVVEIVEAVTPSIARRAPRKGDGTVASNWGGEPLFNCRCAVSPVTADDLKRAYMGRPKN